MCIRSRCVLLALTLALTYGLWGYAQLHPAAAPPPAEPPAAEKPGPGTVRSNPKDGLKYVWIPAGTFVMGCSPGDSKCVDVEKPAHRVTITRGFWLGQTVVTLGAYKRFASATGRALPAGLFFVTGVTDEKMPIVNMSWYDGQAYCSWAGGRLPSEAEWEYAARGGSTEATYGPLNDVAWEIANSGGKPHEVGQKRANGFGLYDMLGSVLEWVNDWYDENYYRTGPSQDPTGPASGESRVLRGGSWMNHPVNIRASFRLPFNPDKRVFSFGFRCNLDALAP